MKHKIGDLVQIKSEKWYSENANSNGEIFCDGEDFVDSMTPYLGKRAYITNIIEDCFYTLDIDEGVWNWVDDMFEDNVK